MRRTSFEGMNCSIAQCLEMVGEWWTLLIVRDALMGVTRFEDFRERLGIARNVLTQRLEHLVAQDIMTKVPYQANPVRHDYRLTAKGRSLWLVLTAMRQWGDQWAAPDGPRCSPCTRPAVTSRCSSRCARHAGNGCTAVTCSRSTVPESATFR